MHLWLNDLIFTLHMHSHTLTHPHTPTYTFIHSTHSRSQYILRGKLKLRMFENAKGTWIIMFIGTFLCVYVASGVLMYIYICDVVCLCGYVSVYMRVSEWITCSLAPSSVFTWPL
jgi:hypothetical protein